MSDSDITKLVETELATQETKSEQVVKKQGRKKKVVPEEIVIDKPEVETISYSKAEKLTRVKRGMSDKQKENVLKLIQLNKERREKLKEDEMKAKQLEEAKAKQKVLKVLPKRERKKKVETKSIQREDTESDDSDSDNVPPVVSESEGTKDIKKKVKKLQSITNALDNIPEHFKKETSSNPYLGVLQKSGFK